MLKCLICINYFKEIKNSFSISDDSSIAKNEEHTFKIVDGI